MFYNGREKKVNKLFDDYTALVPKAKSEAKHGKSIKCFKEYQ